MRRRFFSFWKEAALNGARTSKTPQDATTAISGFRTRMAWGLFARWVLGRAGKPPGQQVEEVLTALTLAGAPEGLLPDAKTLLSWSRPSPPAPKRSKIQALDQLAELAIKVCDPASGGTLRLPRHFFAELVHGGLISQMLQGSKSKQGLTISVLRERASRYRPLSAWHLHCDAVDAASRWEDAHGIAWTDIRRIAGARLQELLLELWRPLDGRIYSLLPSRLSTRWRSANRVERHRTKIAYARLKPNLFDTHFRARREPDWRFLEVERDAAHQHVHKLLFVVAADDDFLQDEALSAWSLDMASAGLAAMAVAWSDRYLHFGGRIETDFRSFWAGFDSIFYGRGHLSSIELSIASAMATSGVPPASQWAASLLRGRDAYQREMRRLGLTFQHVRRSVGQAMDAHPLEYSSRRQAVQ